MSKRSEKHTSVFFFAFILTVISIAPITQTHADVTTNLNALKDKLVVLRGSLVTLKDKLVTLAGRLGTVKKKLSGLKAEVNLTPAKRSRRIIQKNIDLVTTNLIPVAAGIKVAPPTGEKTPLAIKKFINDQLAKKTYDSETLRPLEKMLQIINKMQNPYNNGQEKDDWDRRVEKVKTFIEKQNKKILAPDKTVFVKGANTIKKIPTRLLDKFNDNLDTLNFQISLAD